MVRMTILRYNYRITCEDSKVHRNAIRCLGVCYKSANLMIERCNEDLRSGRKVDLQSAYTWATRDAKKTKALAYLRKASSVAVQQACNDVRLAYMRFFGKKSKPPRFRRYSDPRSARFVGTAFKVEGNRLYLANIGWATFRMSRPLPSAPTSATLILETDGKLYVSFVVELSEALLPKAGADCGIDVGMRRYATIASAKPDDSVEIYAVASLATLVQKSEKRQRRLEKRLARKRGPNRKAKVTASRNWKKVRRQLSKAQLKQRRIRRDAIHQLSHRLTRDHDLISIETLNVKAMAKQLGRSVQRNPIGGLLREIEQKAKRRGRSVVHASPFFPSSKTCSSCRSVYKGLQRNTKAWTCPSCGASHDRDGNASVNLLRLTGRMAVPRDTRELMPCSVRLHRTPPSQEGGLRGRLRASAVSTVEVGAPHGEGTCAGDGVRSQA